MKAPRNRSDQSPARSLFRAALAGLILQACGGLNNDPGLSSSQPFKMELTSAPTEKTAGACGSEPLLLSILQKTNEATVYIDEDVVITAKAFGGESEVTSTVFLHSTESCRNDSASLTLSKGNAQLSFYLQVTLVEVTRITLESSLATIAGTSFDLSVVPNLPGAIELSNLPGTAVPNTPFTSNPLARITDAWGNFVSDATSGVILSAFGNDECTSSSSGALQNGSSTAVNGEASFTSLRFNPAGIIYLQASIPDTQILSQCEGPVTVVTP